MLNDVSWKRISIEGFVIVISILLAFAIEASWQERQNRIQDRQLLTSLHQDLLENQLRIVDQISTLERTVDSLQEFLELDLESSRPSLEEEDYFRLLSPLVRTYTDSGLVAGFIDSTISSGSLTQIESSGIRTAIAEIQNRRVNLAVISNDIQTLTDQLLIELGKTPKIFRLSRDRGTFNFHDLDVEYLDELHSNSQLLALSWAKLSRFDSYRVNFNGLNRDLQRVIDIVSTELES